MGFNIWIVPEVEIKHASGASSKDPRFAQWKGEFRGLILFYKKRFGLLLSLFIRLLIYKAIFLRILGYWLIGKTNISKTYGKVLANI